MDEERLVNVLWAIEHRLEQLVDIGAIQAEAALCPMCGHVHYVSVKDWKETKCSRCQSSLFPDINP